MTFKEATEFKNKLGRDTITEQGMTMRVFVTPANPDDIKKYFEEFRAGGFTDKTAIMFCTTGQFIVQGLWTDGTNVLWKDLNK